MVKGILGRILKLLPRSNVIYVHIFLAEESHVAQPGAKG